MCVCVCVRVCVCVCVTPHTTNLFPPPGLHPCHVCPQVNTSITVLQLAAIVAEQTPGDAPFSLSAGFPPVALVDAAATVESAGLKGASITQK